MTYEQMWDVVKQLALGYTQRTVSVRLKVPKSDVACVAKYYNVGRRPGQTREQVRTATVQWAREAA
jgi:hypothetical protein